MLINITFALKWNQDFDWIWFKVHKYPFWSRTITQMIFSFQNFKFCSNKNLRLSCEIQYSRITPLDIEFVKKIVLHGKRKFKPTIYI